jgi:hypothetical protein
MLRKLKRVFAAIVAGVAIQPASGSAVIKQEHREQREFEQLENSLGDYAVSNHVDSRAYQGPRTILSDDLIEMTRNSKRFRNAAIDQAGARAEVEKFIQERTR